jgi:hypothetical protein
MHSDVAIEIAYSGEFFVRLLPRHKHQQPGTSERHRSAEPDADGAEPDVDGAEPNDSTYAEMGVDEDHPPDDPALYELVIDNDSGTYRPRADLLPTLHSYLASPSNLGALGRITCIQAFDERLKKWKDARKERKKAEGSQAAQPTGSLSTSASSSVSSLAEAGAPEGENDVKVGDLQAVVEEDAKRARDNNDSDGRAEEEKAQDADNASAH